MGLWIAAAAVAAVADVAADGDSASYDRRPGPASAAPSTREAPIDWSRTRGAPVYSRSGWTTTTTTCQSRTTAAAGCANVNCDRGIPRKSAAGRSVRRVAIRVSAVTNAARLFAQYTRSILPR